MNSCLEKFVRFIRIMSDGLDRIVALKALCRDEISTRPAEKDFTLRLHVEIKFRPGKAAQFST